MRKKRLIAVLLLVVRAALPRMEASAASVRYIKSPNGKKVNLRTGPGDKAYGVATQVAPGTEVTLISSKNGWSEIRYNGYTLYVMSKYLTATKPSASSSSSSSAASAKTRYITSRDGKKVNLRTGPGETGYAVGTQLEPGTEVQFVSRKNGWSKVVYNGFTLYVKNQFLSTKKPGSPSSSSSTSTATSVRYIKSSNLKKVNARTGPGLKGYAVATQLEPGTEVQFVSRKNGWSKIIYNGFTLYVQNQYLTTKKP